jgi:uncharacterized membrane protein HdeD (DUF308 family)
MGIYDRDEAADRSRRRLRIGYAILIASGTLSVVAPLIAGLSISLVWGLAILVAGLAHGILAFGVRERGASLCLTLVSIAFLVVAMTLLAKRDVAVATATLAVAASFLIEAATEVAYFVIARPRSDSMWALVNAIPTILIALAICSDWLRSSTWGLGIVVGIALIVSGLTWIPRSRSNSSYSVK